MSRRALKRKPDDIENVWLLLSDAAAFAQRCLKIDDTDVKARLIEAFRNKSIRTSGLPFYEENGSFGYSDIHVNAGDLCRWIDQQ